MAATTSGATSSAWALQAGAGVATPRRASSVPSGPSSTMSRPGSPGAPSGGVDMIRKLPSGEYRLYSRKKDPKTGRRRNLGTFATREAAEKHERAIQFFKRAH